MLRTSMKVKDVEILEVIFAKMTETGWVIPDWLMYLRSVVTRRFPYET